MEPSTITKDLYNYLQYSAQKQKVISSNIANADTPEYKTKDVSFSYELNKASEDLKLNVTNNKHIMPDDTNKDPFEIETYEVKGLAEQNDGNNVSMDKQVSEMSKNSVYFQALQNSIKQDSNMFKQVIDSSGKN